MTLTANDMQIFAKRRDEFRKRMKDGIAIIPSAPEYLRNGDVYHEYRQDSDFFYLTGFEEPGALAILSATGDKPFTLFVPKRDKMMEIWHGRRAGPEGAVETYKADQAFTVEEIDAKVPDILKGATSLFVRFGNDKDFDARVMGWVNQVRRMARQGVNPPTELRDVAAILHEMRLIKNEDDIRFLRRACELSAEAFRVAMAKTAPGKNEYEVQAELEYVCRMGGSPRQGYPSIVAGGDNANILHYHENNMPLNDGDLLLIDAGCEYGHYSADITRTWPVNGKFTDAQREVYEWVLKAQEAAIDLCRVGHTFREVHDRAVEVLTEGCVAMGLLEGNPADIIAAQAKWDEDLREKRVDPKTDKPPRTYREFYMHNTGHWLGMDVHDVGRYKHADKWRNLEPGCVLTVEPGLYISAERTDVPEKYRGIGVRIEDDVLVTDGDPDVLTRDAPKTVADIEAAMAG